MNFLFLTVTARSRELR